jgi:transcriptional regulator with XRE-family HTH domain
MQKYVSIGERVAVYRRRRGMSQTQLGGLVQRSESWVSQVERGARPIERLGILTELARVLDVPMTELTGQPPPVVRDPQSQHELVAEVQLALSEFDFLAALLAGPSEQAEGRADLSGLRAGVERAWVLTHGSQYTELGPLLRTLLRDGQAAVRRSDDREAYELLCRTYQVVAAVMAKLGETELAWVAADRSVMAVSGPARHCSRSSASSAWQWASSADGGSTRRNARLRPVHLRSRHSSSRDRPRRRPCTAR